MFEPHYRIAFDSHELLTRHPPRFHHPHKAALFELAYPDGRAPAREIRVSRWPPIEDRDIEFSERTQLEVRADFYDYEPVSGVGSGIEWHVNFADPQLFGAYGSGLLAQDEMQVVQHPLLGCVREGLLAVGLSAMTEGADHPTPILVSGVERRIRLDTRPDASSGRPHGLYGGLFAQAPLTVVHRAAARLEPPGLSNIIAMAAPFGGRGAYRATELRRILTTAWTAFAAARKESEALGRGSEQTWVHSGLWGCGVFGGNRTLMLALQILSARAAGLTGLILHVGHDPLGMGHARESIDLADRLHSRCGGHCERDWLGHELAELGFRWGIGDGN